VSGFQKSGDAKIKSRLGLGKNILGGTGGHAGTPLTLVATVAESEGLDDFRLFALGALANLAPLVTSIANRFAGLVARLHRFDPSTLRAGLVSGRIAVASHLVASIANRCAGLAVFVNSSRLPTRVANTPHNLTPFGLRVGFGLKKDKIRSPNLILYPTLLLASRQDQNEKRNSTIFFLISYPFFFLCAVPEVGFEPTRDCSHTILSRTRKPFRHSGSKRLYCTCQKGHCQSRYIEGGFSAAFGRCLPSFAAQPFQQTLLAHEFIHQGGPSPALYPFYAFDTRCFASVSPHPFFDHPAAIAGREIFKPRQPFKNGEDDARVAVGH
jgi:hypothetical protein